MKNNYLFLSYLFCLGAVFGSFFNVVVLRYRAENNNLMNRSECRSCKKRIHWYENIPIISFVFLRGKCSGCKTNISFQYPFVELVSGIAMLALWDGDFQIRSFSMLGFHFLVFGCFLCHFLIDLKQHILPNEINLLLAVIFVVYSVIEFNWNHWVLGGIVGIGFPGLVTYLFYKLRGKIGLGMGDIKLYGALGLLLGPYGIIMNIFLSCFLGAIVGGVFIILAKKGKDTPIPFGPSIVVVSSFQIFFPEQFSQLLSLVVQ